jgi:hypothetical protein
MTMEHNYTATRTVEMAAAEKLVIKAEEVKLLDEKVPNGKTWAVTVKVEIIETDA